MVVCRDKLYRRGSELNIPRFLKRGIVFLWGDIRDSSAYFFIIAHVWLEKYSVAGIACARRRVTG